MLVKSAEDGMVILVSVSIGSLFGLSPEHVEEGLLVGLDVALHRHEPQELVERHGVVRPVDGDSLRQRAGLLLWGFVK